MTKAERFIKAVRGEEVDRPPVSAWLHFASGHLSPGETADLHLRFFKEYDWDYIKVMNDYTYPYPGPELSGTRDLYRFEPLNLAAPPFTRQLEVLRRIRLSCGEDVPVIETVFDPLQTLVRSCGRRALEFVLTDRRAGLQALEAITRTLVNYIGACREVGVSGIFYSVNWAMGPGHGGLNSGDFAALAAPFDHRLLEAAAGLVRIGHIHGEDLDFERVRSYPLEVFSWSHAATPPTLSAVRRDSGKAVIGGIDERNLAFQTVSQVEEGIRRAFREAGPRGFLVGPGCTVPPDTPVQVLHAVRHAVESLTAG